MAVVCEVRNVHKRYGDTVALDGVSLAVRPSEIVGLVGPNGAGKTTLVRIVATLLTPTSGTVTIAGRDALTDPFAVRPVLAIVPQGAAPDPYATPWEHTVHYLRARGVPRRDAEERGARVLRSLGLWERRDVRALQLSGGYQRRVLLAMALATAPRLLLLDEPTTALDPGARRMMWNLLADVRAETSILLTTHDMAEAQVLSDRVALIAEGRLVATGTVDALLGRLPSREKFVVESGDACPVPVRDRGTVDRVAGKLVVYPHDDGAARALATELLDAQVRFSVQPVTLEDVYFRMLSPAPAGERSAGGIATPLADYDGDAVPGT